MKNNYFVIDANVLLEYMLDRKYKEKTVKLLKKAADEEIFMAAPGILYDEVVKVLNGALDKIQDVRLFLNFMEELIESQVLDIVIPEKSAYLKAVSISREGNPKSGFPEFSDSLYHALAIENNATFITNDRRHYLKAKQFGHILLFKDMRI